jgi:hypothetical protein
MRKTNAIGLWLATGLLGACDGGGGGGGFMPATPPADVCAMLTLADVQGLQPSSTAGVEQQTGDNTSLGFWARDCKWDGGSTSVELVVFGALNAQGLAGIKAAARSGKVLNMAVSGLGTEAHYWQDQMDVSGLWAISGFYSVDVTSYFITPYPAEASFHPLVAKALGQLP